MGEFDYYPDMNQDGKVDSYDRAVFYDLMDQEEVENESRSQYVSSHSTPPRPRDLTDAQREQMRIEQQAGEIARWSLIAVFGLIAWACFCNQSEFTVVLGLFSAVGIIRLLTL